MGPNDVKRVVWAICEFFSSLFKFFPYLLTIHYVCRYGICEGKVETRVTSPNDAFRVVGGICELSFSFFVFFNY